MQRISHSQADAYNACEKKFEYAHIELLQPKTRPTALARGSYGHKIMETFFNCIKDGEGADIGLAKAMALAIQDQTYFNDIWNQINHWITEVWPTLDWKIIEVEKTYYLPLGPDKEYPFTADLLIETMGKLVIVDHKFSADAYDDEMIELYPQIPKYIGALRAQGINVSHGIYNFLRTRSMKDVAQQIVMKQSRPNNARVRESFKAQLETVKRIENHTGPYLRTFSNNCKYCSFIDLCRVEMSGGDSTEMKRIGYEPNDYGYQDKVVDL